MNRKGWTIDRGRWERGATARSPGAKKGIANALRGGRSAGINVGARTVQIVPPPNPPAKKWYLIYDLCTYGPIKSSDSSSLLRIPLSTTTNRHFPSDSNSSPSNISLSCLSASEYCHISRSHGSAPEFQSNSRYVPLLSLLQWNLALESLSRAKFRLLLLSVLILDGPSPNCNPENQRSRYPLDLCGAFHLEGFCSWNMRQGRAG